VPALEAPDHVGSIREEIDDLALAFVSPLQTDDDDASAHGDVLDLIHPSP
jgi:hypothetical protein